MGEVSDQNETALHAALENVSATTREVILARLENPQLTLLQLATKLGCSYAAVHYHLRRSAESRKFFKEYQASVLDRSLELRELALDMIEEVLRNPKAYPLEQVLRAALFVAEKTGVSEQNQKGIEVRLRYSLEGQ